MLLIAPRKHLRIAMACFFVILGFTSNSFAQCPPITNSNPVICDAAGLRVIHLDTYATDLGNGLDWYNAATGGTKYADTQLLREGIYFVDNSSGTCGTRLSVTVDFVVNPTGQNLDGIFCDNENATVQTYIDEVLSPNVPSGGTALVYTNLTLASQANPATPLTGTSNFFIVFEDLAGCRSQIEFGSTATFSAPETPTPPLEQHFCSDTNPTVANLNPGTTLSFNWYDDVDTNGDPIQPALEGSASLINGNTYYIQAEGVFCSSDLVAVLVILDNPSNPGINAFLEYCEDTVPTTDFNLYDSLGLADTTGTWSGPLATQNGYLGTVNIGALTPGNYTFTYTIETLNSCPSTNSIVTILIAELRTSGTPSTANPATFCETDLPSDFDLFTLLIGHDLNGVWTTGTTSGGTVVTSPIDLTGYTEGVYDFTYTQNAAPSPCAEESTTVQIIVLPEPNPGNAINTVFCENDLTANSPFNLFDALDGTQDNATGVWTNANGDVVTNPIDITSFTAAGSPYMFIYTLDNGTCSASETITISVLPSPNSGEALNPIDICSDDLTANSPFNLFSLLDGTQDTNGTWYEGATTSGTAVTNPIDLTGLTVGTYLFTYSVPSIGSCSDAPTTVQINIVEAPNAGTAIPVIICENDIATNSPFDLFTALDGSQDNNAGVWTDASGVVVSNPIDISGFTVTGSPYNYTYTIVTGSCDTSETIIITIVESPNAGVALDPLQLCENEISGNSPFDLFNLLDGSQNLNGTWYEGTDTSGTVAINPIDLTTLGFGIFNYTYAVPAIGSCLEEAVTVQIELNESPETGSATPFVVCSTDVGTNTPIDLFGQLTGNDAGGIWNDDDATGALTGSMVDLTVLSVGTYSFTYSITSSEGCENGTTVLITIEEAANAGTAENVAFCMIEIPSNPTLDLFSQLTGNDTGGTWNDDDASGALSGSTVDLTALPIGVYNFTYTVLGAGTCADDAVTVIITIEDSAAPTAVSPQDFCDSATVANLVATGTDLLWYDSLTVTTPLLGTTPLVTNTTYYVTQTTANGCESSVRTAVLVHISQSPNSGIAVVPPVTVCTDNTTVDLNTGLDGSQDASGVWQDTDSTGALTGNNFDASQVSAGTYTFTYFVVGTLPCIDASTQITVTVQDAVSAGTSTTLDVCSDTTPIDLFVLLGTATTGGTWSPALASGTSIFDPLLDGSGIYTYSIANSCSSDTSTVTITVTPAADAGISTTASLCVSDGTINLYDLLDGTPDATGTWSPVLASGTNVFDPTLDIAGIYTYTVLATAPCTGDASSQINITISDSPEPTILQADISFCASERPTVADLFGTVSGNNITWYNELDDTTPLASTTALVDGEDYYSSQTNASGCESSVRSEITVTVSDAPTPTLVDDGAVFCINEHPTLETLSENIVEASNQEFIINWYDDDAGGNLIAVTTPLTNNTTYYASLLNVALGCESSVRLPVTVDLSGCLGFTVPDGFSPNGDGTNDTFDIDNLDFLFPNFIMEVYNRYGSLVYKGNANTSRFDGTSNQSGVLSKGNLPVGVYFYILNVNDGITEPQSGRVYLSR